MVGVFVGGRGRRMGGLAKGLLPAPGGGTLIERLLVLCRSCLPEASLVLVGEASAYAGCQLPVLADAPSGIGPLGGLRALLRYAAAGRHECVLVLACDLPYVSARWVGALATALPGAIAVAPRVDGLWYPLSARYSTAALASVEEAIERREHSLQALFTRWGELAHALPASEAEMDELSDWDRPEDIRF